MKKEIKKIIHNRKLLFYNEAKLIASFLRSSPLIPPVTPKEYILALWKLGEFLEHKKKASHTLNWETWLIDFFPEAISQDLGLSPDTDPFTETELFIEFKNYISFKEALNLSHIDLHKTFNSCVDLLIEKRLDEPRIIQFEQFS